MKMHGSTSKLLMAVATLLCMQTPVLAAQDTAVLWSGGIGADERETAPKDGTRLVFFAEGGSFVSAVKVQVSDSSGKAVVDTVTNGPWLILRLPAGRYRVKAELEGAAAQGGMIEVAEGSNREFAFQFRLGQMQ